MPTVGVARVRQVGHLVVMSAHGERSAEAGQIVKTNPKGQILCCAPRSLQQRVLSEVTGPGCWVAGQYSSQVGAQASRQLVGLDGSRFGGFTAVLEGCCARTRVAGWPLASCW